MKFFKIQFFILFCFLLPAARFCSADNWMNWRGPYMNGSGEARSLPVSWSLEGKMENIAWVRDLDGPGSSTPVIFSNYVFLTVRSGSEPEGDLEAVCLSRKDGRINWIKKLGKDRKTARNNMASPSPVTDGRNVYFMFGQGTMAALTLKGELLWARELESDFGYIDNKYGYSASPVLYKGKLYLSVLRRLPVDVETAGDDIKLQSFLVAIDPATGKNLWIQARRTGAIRESKDSYSTPIIFELKENAGLIVTGADAVTCHDPQTGRELWRYNYAEEQFENWRLVSSAVAAGDFICSAMPRGRVLFALKPFKDDFTKTPVLAWKYEGPIPDVCSPAFYKGLIYVLDSGKKAFLTCLRPQDGKVVWQQKLDSSKNFFASPTVADDKIYCISRGGEVFVLSAGKRSKLLSKFSIGTEDCTATISAADDSLFIRTPARIICARLKK